MSFREFLKEASESISEQTDLSVYLTRATEKFRMGYLDSIRECLESIDRVSNVDIKPGHITEDFSDTYITFNYYGASVECKFSNSGYSLDCKVNGKPVGSNSRKFSIIFKKVLKTMGSK